VLLVVLGVVVGEGWLFVVLGVGLFVGGVLVGIGLTPEFEVHAFLATPVSGHGHGATLPSRVAPQLSAIALGARPRQGRYRGLRDR
jgi:hypothetical protein